MLWKREDRYIFIYLQQREGRGSELEESQFLEIMETLQTLGTVLASQRQAKKSAKNTLKE